MFYYEINGFITVARSSMSKPKEFHYALKLYILASFAVAVLMGGFTAAAYGSETEEIIYNNLGEK